MGRIFASGKNRHIYDNLLKIHDSNQSLNDRESSLLRTTNRLLTVVYLHGLRDIDMSNYPITDELLQEDALEYVHRTFVQTIQERYKSYAGEKINRSELCTLTKIFFDHSLTINAYRLLTQFTTSGV